MNKRRFRRDESEGDVSPGAPPDSDEIDEPAHEDLTVDALAGADALDGSLSLSATSEILEGPEEEWGGGPSLLPVASTGAGSLVRHDALTTYLQELRRYPLLTREEEHDLAVKWFEDGDVVAARRLVTSNLRLVVKIAHEYRRTYGTLLDLVQEGNLGLLQAVQKYDPYRGVKLSTYAAWWIRAYILKFILSNWRLVKVGTTQAQRKLFFNLNKERERLIREGFTPDAKLLAERLDVTEQDVTDMQQRLRASDMSLDAPVGSAGGDESGPSHLDYLAGGTRPDENVEGAEFAQLLKQKLENFSATLEGREKTLFEERLISETPLTLHEVGEKYGISRERARQLEKRLTDKLRDYLQEELGEAIDIATGRE